VLDDRLAVWRQRVERELDAWLPPPTAVPERLHAAQRYSVFGPGKRIRPALVYATAETLGVPLERVDAAACAVELIHAYSLVHDDLPAMDDDDLRRGRPTCHRAFDEATAVLAGDSLQVLAFSILARHPGAPADGSVRVQLIATLADASGTGGMAGGQALDLAAEGRHLSLADLEQIHALKTGALIRASVVMAAQCAPGLEAAGRAALERFGTAIGLALWAGLRASEIAAATRHWLEQEGMELRVVLRDREEENFRTKGKVNATWKSGLVIDMEFAAHLLSLPEGNLVPLHGRNKDWFFDNTCNVWVRQFITREMSQKGMHALRAMYAQTVKERFGMHIMAHAASLEAARSALGHQSINTTLNHYLPS
jgi:farnesyl diphosphate synthase